MKKNGNSQNIKAEISITSIILLTFDVDNTDEEVCYTPNSNLV